MHFELILLWLDAYDLLNLIKIWINSKGATLSQISTQTAAKYPFDLWLILLRLSFISGERLWTYVRERKLISMYNSVWTFYMLGWENYDLINNDGGETSSIIRHLITYLYLSRSNKTYWTKDNLILITSDQPASKCVHQRVM